MWCLSLAQGIPNEAVPWSQEPVNADWEMFHKAFNRPNAAIGDESPRHFSALTPRFTVIRQENDGVVLRRRNE